MVVPVCVQRLEVLVLVRRDPRARKDPRAHRVRKGPRDQLELGVMGTDSSANKYRP